MSAVHMVFISVVCPVSVLVCHNMVLIKLLKITRTIFLTLAKYSNALKKMIMPHTGLDGMSRSLNSTLNTNVFNDQF